MNKLETAYFGGGCFWCTEAVFSQLKGVVSVLPGYAGGTTKNPIYEEVSTGRTGHAEVSRVEFDPEMISYETLLKIFFATHDPTTLNQQGPDSGSQYRSIILYRSEAQKTLVENFIKKLTEENIFPKPVVTEIKLLDKFYPAEDYHRKYYEQHHQRPYCQLVISPKINKLRKDFKELLK